MEVVYIPCIILSHRESFIQFVYAGYVASRFGGEWTRLLGTTVTSCVDLFYIHEDFDMSLLLASMYLNVYSPLLEDFWHGAFKFGAQLCTTLLHCRILTERVF